MTAESEDRLKPYLLPEERLLWSGRPCPGIRFLPVDILFLLMGLSFALIVAVWTTALLLVERLPWWVGVIGALIGLAGLLPLGVRFWLDGYLRSRVCYGLTNQRVIILGGFFSVVAKSINLRTVPDIILSEKANGKGSITFGPQPPWLSPWGHAWPGFGLSAAPCFDEIDNVRAVYDMIVKAQQAA